MDSELGTVGKVDILTEQGLVFTEIPFTKLIPVRISLKRRHAPY